jgi:flagellar hook-associated protein 3 FlgL
MIFDTAQQNLTNLTAELSRANQVVASQRRILHLSDDPVGLTQVLNMKSSLSNIEQMERNIGLGKSWLTASESAQTQIQNLISDTKALCVQMSSGNVGSSERISAAEIVQNNLKEVVSLANTQVNGRYIFAGSNSETSAFTIDSNNDVIYNGDHTPFAIKVGKDASVEIGFDGEAVFQPSGSGTGDDMFAVMKNLITSLQGNDISGIQTAMTDLDACFKNTSGQIADVGSKMIRMETKETVLSDIDISTRERLSSIEEPEITEAIMDLKAKEVAYQAALAATSKVLQLSIVNYI